MTVSTSVNDPFLLEHELMRLTNEPARFAVDPALVSLLRSSRIC